jgi:prevent-host-death family protein
MPRKFDPRRRRRVSATEARRSFSRLLDEVERGARFVIHRHGRDVRVLAPPEVQGRKASECLALLRSRPRVTLDDQFGRDLEEILASEPRERFDPWDS